MRDNEFKCPLAAVISVINLIKIIRSEEQKRVLEEKSSNGRWHKGTPPPALIQAEREVPRANLPVNIWYIRLCGS